MRLFSRLLTASILATLPLACSSGSSGAADLKASDLDGTWVVTRTRTAATCGGPVIGEVETLQLTITVNGSKVRLTGTGPGGAVDEEFDLRGSRVQGVVEEILSGFRNTTTIDFGVVSGKLDGSVIEVDVEIATGQEFCRETFRLVGERQSSSPSSPAVANFNGTWNLQTTVTAVSSPSKCGANVGEVDTIEASIAINGSSATLTPAGESAISLNVVNGRLTGTETEDAGSGLIGTTVFDLGLVTNDSCSGTITATLTLGGAVLCQQSFQVAGTRAVL